MVSKILMGNRAVIVAVVAVLIMVAKPVPVFADGCGLLSIIFGGDCVSTLDAGFTDRAEIREDGSTERVELEQSGMTDRTQIEQQNETLRAQMEQQNATLRTQMEQQNMTERERIAADALRHMADQQTTQVLADALARQNAVEDLSATAQRIAELDAQVKQQRDAMMVSLVNRALALLVGITLLACMAVYQRKSQKSLPSPSYWEYRPTDEFSEKGEIIAYERPTTK